MLTRKRMNEVFEYLFWVGFVLFMTSLVLSPAFYENSW